MHVQEGTRDTFIFMYGQGGISHQWYVTTTTAGTTTKKSTCVPVSSKRCCSGYFCQLSITHDWVRFSGKAV